MIMPTRKLRGCWPARSKKRFSTTGIAASAKIRNGNASARSMTQLIDAVQPAPA